MSIKRVISGLNNDTNAGKLMPRFRGWAAVVALWTILTALESVSGARRSIETTNDAEKDPSHEKIETWNGNSPIPNPNNLHNGVNKFEWPTESSEPTSPQVVRISSNLGKWTEIRVNDSDDHISKGDKKISSDEKFPLGVDIHIHPARRKVADRRLAESNFDFTKTAAEKKRASFARSFYDADAQISAEWSVVTGNRVRDGIAPRSFSTPDYANGGRYHVEAGSEKVSSSIPHHEPTTISRTPLITNSWPSPRNSTVSYDPSSDGFAKPSDRERKQSIEFQSAFGDSAKRRGESHPSSLGPARNTGQIVASHSSSNQSAADIRGQAGSSDANFLSSERPFPSRPNKDSRKEAVNNDVHVNFRKLDQLASKSIKKTDIEGSHTTGVDKATTGETNSTGSPGKTIHSCNDQCGNSKKSLEDVRYDRVETKTQLPLIGYFIPKRGRRLTLRNYSQEVDNMTAVEKAVAFKKANQPTAAGAPANADATLLNSRSNYATNSPASGLRANGSSDMGAGLIDLENSTRPATAVNQWPVKHSAVVEGDLVLGGLMMVHEREDSVMCGPVMPQGGVQALEAMLYTLDRLNEREIVPGVKVGAHILDDCDKDTYGLEMAVDFIKGRILRYISFRVGALNSAKHLLSMHARRSLMDVSARRYDNNP